MADDRGGESAARVSAAPGACVARSDWRIADDAYRAWVDRVEAPALSALASSDAAAQALEHGPLISIALPVFNTPVALLREAIESVLAQSYQRWELCVVDDASTAAGVEAVLAEYEQRDSRVRRCRRERNGGISAASNDALAMATGSYLALLDHDDLLAPHALLLVAMAMLARPAVQLWYTDSDDLDQQGNRCNPFFKPAFNYELVLGQNYFNHLTVHATALLRQLGGWREAFDASQDYDLLLRVLEQLTPEQVGHVPHVLYHWRVVAESVARSDLARACRVARMAVAEHLQRTHQAAEVVPAPGALIYNRVLRAVPQPAAGVSVVLYGAAEAQLQAAAQEMRRQCMTGSEQVLIAAGTTDTAAVLNTLCQAIPSPILCFVHASARLELQAFLNEARGLLAQPGVAAVGPKLQSTEAGEALGPLHTGTGDAGVAAECPGATLDSKGYFAGLRLSREVRVLHCVALAVSAASFRDVGGFSAGLCHPLLLGADIALKLIARGERCIWTPFATADCPPALLTDATVPAPAAAETELFTRRWREQLDDDPFYNPNFDQRDACFRLGRPPDFPATATTRGNHPR